MDKMRMLTELGFTCTVSRTLQMLLIEHYMEFGLRQGK